MRTLPSTDPMDPGYRRLRYLRYADDHLLGFTGPKAEAEQIKARLAAFLRETLGLELNAAKTLISHARTRRARFLGYDIIVQHSSTKITRSRRSANGKIALRVPPDVVRSQCARYRQHGKPWHRSRLQNLDDYDIVRVYGAEYRGVVNYYLLAQDVWRLRALRWHAETSMLKTLAAKHKSTVTKMAARHQAKVITGDGPRTCFEARRKRKGKPDLVARFGGITLRQDRRAVITDPAPVRVRVPRKELLSRPAVGDRARIDPGSADGDRVGRGLLGILTVGAHGEGRAGIHHPVGRRHRGRRPARAPGRSLALRAPACRSSAGTGRIPSRSFPPRALSGGR
jgi:Type II intron maturase